MVDKKRFITVFAKEFCKYIIDTKNHSPNEARQEVLTLIIFYALESTQTIFGDKEVLWCRFSMSDNEEYNVKAYLQDIRESKLKRKYNKSGSKSLIEFLLDFSITNRRLNNFLMGDIDQKIKILVGAESEFANDQKKVCRDLLKLCLIDAQLKVMIFGGITKRQLKNWTKSIEATLKHDQHAESEYLILSIPRIKVWLGTHDSKDKPTLRLYTVGNTQKLEDITEDYWPKDCLPKSLSST